jgi:hypothetical protein
VTLTDDQNTVDRSDDEVDQTATRGPRQSDGDEDPYDDMKPDVVAPGTNLITADYSERGEAGGYSDKGQGGSSYATPHVAGAAALMLEANPDLTAYEIKDLLHRTAESRGEPLIPELSDKYNGDWGWGLLDAYEAVNMALDFKNGKKPPEINSVLWDANVTAPGGVVTLTVGASDPDGDSLQYNYKADMGTISGSGSKVTWKAPNTVGVFSIYISVSDGIYESYKKVINIRVEPSGDNHPPSITGITSDPSGSVPAGSVVQISVIATDPENDPLTYKYDVTGGTISGVGAVVSWNAPTEPGTYTIIATVNDGEFDSLPHELVLMVASNQDPVIDGVSINPDPVPLGESAQIRVNAHDPDGDELRYEYSIDEGTLSSADGSKVTWTAPFIEDTYVLNIKVYDSWDAFAERNFKIDVAFKNFAPQIQLASVDPNTVPNDGTGQFLILVQVDDQNSMNDIKSVVADLSQLKGLPGEALSDLGRKGDLIAGDGTYSLQVDVPSKIDKGIKTIYITVYDFADVTASTSISVEISAGAKKGGDEESFEGIPLPGFDSILVVISLSLVFVIFRYNKHIQNY